VLAFPPLAVKVVEVPGQKGPLLPVTELGGLLPAPEQHDDPLILPIVMYCLPGSGQLTRLLKHPEGSPPQLPVPDVLSLAPPPYVMVKLVMVPFKQTCTSALVPLQINLPSMVTLLLPLPTILCSGGLADVALTVPEPVEIVTLSFQEEEQKAAQGPFRLISYTLKQGFVMPGEKLIVTVVVVEVFVQF
jgi:hypothetical protein